MKLFIRFLIGLSSPSDSASSTRGLSHAALLKRRAAVRARKAKEVLSQHYTGFNVTQGTGYWEGKAEPCLIAEAIMNDTEGNRFDARRWARELAITLGQSCVGLTFAPVSFELVEPAP